MRDKIIAIIEDELGGNSVVTEATRLDELELDSLEFVELMTRIGRECADIPDADWAKLETVADLITAVEARCAA